MCQDVPIFRFPTHNLSSFGKFVNIDHFICMRLKYNFSVKQRIKGHS